MIFYAVGKPGDEPRLSTNPLFLRQAEDEVVLQLDGWPEGEVVISEDGLSLVALDVPIARQKADRWVEARTYRDSRTNGLCPTPAGVVQIDDASKLKINGAVNMAMLAMQAGQAYSINWTMADNTVTTLDAKGMIGMGVAVGQMVSACQDASTAVRAAIDAAEDAQTLNAIDITTGYPDAS